ncbi:hypothetical protein BaRGS_00036624 [Batillaria attramentaria]|uniref:Uncharacterized protein n=1 Tax=Batillaria attramentaria TaxID=370345 RepID=A0ABD0JB15_9CAEN
MRNSVSISTAVFNLSAFAGKSGDVSSVLPGVGEKTKLERVTEGTQYSEVQGTNSRAVVVTIPAFQPLISSSAASIAPPRSPPSKALARPPQTSP